MAGIHMNDVMYFAYGSNMLRQRLEARCPHVRAAGVAALMDHRLVFDQYSPVDDSGKGGIAAAPGAVVHGVVWSLPPGDLPALDRAEGCGRSYARIQCAVTRGCGRSLQAITYLPIDLRPGLQPWDWYIKLVIAGAEQHDLPADYVASIRRLPYRIDPQLDRAGRRIWLAALARAGWGA